MTTIPKSNLQIAFSQPVALCLLLDTSFKMPLKTIDALQIPKTNKSPQKERHREEKETKKEKGRKWKKENKEKS